MSKIEESMKRMKAKVAKRSTNSKNKDVKITADQEKYKRILVTRYRPKLSMEKGMDANCEGDARLYILMDCVKRWSNGEYKKACSWFYALYYTAGKCSFTESSYKDFHLWEESKFNTEMETMKNFKLNAAVKTDTVKLAKTFNVNKDEKWTMKQVLEKIDLENLTYLQKRELLNYAKNSYNKYMHLKSTLHVSDKINVLEDDEYLKEWFSMSASDPINDSPNFKTRSNKLKLIMSTIRMMKMNARTQRVMLDTFTKGSLDEKIKIWWQKKASFIMSLLSKLANSEHSVGIRTVFQNIMGCVGYYLRLVNVMSGKSLDLDKMASYASSLEMAIGESANYLLTNMLKEDMDQGENVELYFCPEMVNVIEFSVINSEFNDTIGMKFGSEIFRNRVYMLTHVNADPGQTQLEFENSIELAKGNTGTNTALYLKYENGYLRGLGGGFGGRIARPKIGQKELAYITDAKNMALKVGNLYALAYGGEMKNINGSNDLVMYCQMCLKFKTNGSVSEEDKTYLKNMAEKYFGMIKGTVKTSIVKYKRSLETDIPMAEADNASNAAKRLNTTIGEASTSMDVPDVTSAKVTARPDPSVIKKNNIGKRRDDMKMADLWRYYEVKPSGITKNDMAVSRLIPGDDFYIIDGKKVNIYTTEEPFERPGDAISCSRQIAWGKLKD